MKPNLIKNYKKVLSLSIICLFIINNISWSINDSLYSVKEGKLLQVQSQFNPILSSREAIGNPNPEFRDKAEKILILFMAAKGYYPVNINSAILGTYAGNSGAPLYRVKEVLSKDDGIFVRVVSKPDSGVDKEEEIFIEREITDLIKSGKFDEAITKLGERLTSKVDIEPKAANTGAHFGTKKTYDPDFKPFRIDGREISFDEAHRYFVRDSLKDIKASETFIVKIEFGAKEPFPYIKPDGSIDERDFPTTLAYKLSEYFSRYPLKPGDIYYFYIFSGAKKLERGIYGKSPYALVDHGDGENSEFLFAEAGSGGIPGEPKRSIYITREFFESLSVHTLDEILQEEIEHADSKYNAAINGLGFGGEFWTSDKENLTRKIVKTFELWEMTNNFINIELQNTIDESKKASDLYSGGDRAAGLRFGELLASLDYEKFGMLKDKINDEAVQRNINLGEGSLIIKYVAMKTYDLLMERIGRKAFNITANSRIFLFSTLFEITLRSMELDQVDEVIKWGKEYEKAYNENISAYSVKGEAVMDKLIPVLMGRVYSLMADANRTIAERIAITLSNYKSYEAEVVKYYKKALEFYKYAEEYRANIEGASIKDEYKDGSDRSEYLRKFKDQIIRQAETVFMTAICNLELLDFEKAKKCFGFVAYLCEGSYLKLLDSYKEDEDAYKIIYSKNVLSLGALSRAYLSGLVSVHTDINFKEAQTHSKKAMEMMEKFYSQNPDFWRNNFFIVTRRAQDIINSSPSFTSQNAMSALELLDKFTERFGYVDEIFSLKAVIYRELTYYYRKKGDLNLAIMSARNARVAIDVLSRNGYRHSKLLTFTVDAALGELNEEEFSAYLGDPNGSIRNVTELLFALSVYMGKGDVDNAKILLEVIMSRSAKLLKYNSFYLLVNEWRNSQMMGETLLDLIVTVLKDVDLNKISYKKDLIDFIIQARPEGFIDILEDIRDHIRNGDKRRKNAVADYLDKKIPELEKSASLTPDEWLDRLKILSEKGKYEKILTVGEYILQNVAITIIEEQRGNFISIVVAYMEAARAKIDSAGKAAAKKEALDKLYKDALNAYNAFDLDTAATYFLEAMEIDPDDPRFDALQDKIQFMESVRSLYWDGKYEEALAAIENYHGERDTAIASFRNRVETVISAQSLLRDSLPAKAERILSAMLEAHPVDKDKHPGETVLYEINKRLELVRRENAALESLLNSGDVDGAINKVKVLVTLDRENEPLVRNLLFWAKNLLGNGGRVKKDLENSKILSEGILSAIDIDFLKSLKLYDEVRTLNKRAYAGILLIDLESEKEMLEAWISAQNNIARRSGNITYWTFDEIESTYKGFIVRGVKAYTDTGEVKRAERLPFFQGESLMFFNKEQFDKDRARSASKVKGHTTSSPNDLSLTKDSLPSRLFELKEIVGDRLTFQFSREDDLPFVRQFLQDIAKGGIFTKVKDATTERQIARLKDAITWAREIFENGKFTYSINGVQKMALGLAETVMNGPASPVELKNKKIEGDESQKEAVFAMVDTKRPVTYVHGPPGGGKTTVITEAAQHFVERGKRVLILSQSNPAVNNVGEKLLNDDGSQVVPFVRVGNDETKISEKIKPYWSHTTNGQIIENLAKNHRPNKNGFVVLGTINGFLNDWYMKKAGSKGYGHLFEEYDVVIIEEASRATIAETLVGIGKAKEKVIFVGDHKQLPAHGLGDDAIRVIRGELSSPGFNLSRGDFDRIFSMENKKTERVSLFQRMILENARRASLDYHLLSVNYRSHWAISTPVSLATYEGKLLHRDYKKDTEYWEKPEIDTFTIVNTETGGRTHPREKELVDTRSHYNVSEVYYVLESVDWILNQMKIDPETGQRVWRYNPKDIFILTPYSAQIEVIREALRLKAYLNDVERVGTLLKSGDGKSEILKIIEDIKLLDIGPNYLIIKPRGGLRTFKTLSRKLSEIEDMLIHERTRYDKRSASDVLSNDVSELRSGYEDAFDLSSSGPRKLSARLMLDIPLDVLTVDQIQGSENKVVILSMVRTGEDLGFLAREEDGLNRLNVAISRAKEKLIMIGSFNTLTGQRGKKHGRTPQIEKVYKFFQVLFDFRKKLEKEYELHMPIFHTDYQVRPKWIIGGYRSRIERGNGETYYAGGTETLIDEAERAVKPANLVDRDAREKVISETIMAGNRLFNIDTIDAILKRNNNEAQIVVDLSLICKDNVQESMALWAELILYARNYKNIKFVFENTGTNLKVGPESRELSNDIDTAPLKEDAIRILEDKIVERAIFYGINDETEVIDFIHNRVKTQRAAGSDLNITNPIEIIITSDHMLEWIGRNNLLERSQHPVAMSGYTTDEDGNIALRNFHASFVLALAKVALINLRDSGGLAESGELQVIIDRLNNFYKIVFEKDTKPFSSDMILKMLDSENLKQRISAAIDLAIPPAGYLSIEDIRESYEFAASLEVAA